MRQTRTTAAGIVWTVLLALGCSDESDDVAGPGPEVGPSLADYIVFSAQVNQTGNDIQALDLETMTRIILTTGPEHDTQPAISPDASTVAFSRRSEGATANQIFLVNADGSGLRPITAMANDATHPEWSPDGKKIAFASGGDVWVVDADGSDLTQLTSRELVTEYRYPVWAPDGSSIAYVVVEGSSGISAIRVVAPDGSNPIELSRFSGVVAQFLAWSPDGTEIAFSLPNSGLRDIYLMNANGSGLRNLTNSVADDRDPTWSPDGSQIAFASHGLGNPSNWDVWVMDANGTPIMNVTNSAVNEFSPHWSPRR